MRSLLDVPSLAALAATTAKTIAHCQRRDMTEWSRSAYKLEIFMDQLILIILILNTCERSRSDNYRPKNLSNIISFGISWSENILEFLWVLKVKIVIVTSFPHKVVCKAEPMSHKTRWTDGIVTYTWNKVESKRLNNLVCSIWQYHTKCGLGIFYIDLKRILCDSQNADQG